MKKKYFKLLIYMLIAILFFSCKTNLNIQEDEILYKDAKITVGKTPISEIEKQFGTNYSKRNWNNYSWEYIYKKNGISFTYKQKDSLRTIYWFNANTKKNKINIENRLTISSKSKVKDFIEVFDDSHWYYNSNYNDLIVFYEYYGIIVKLKDKDIRMLQKDSLFDNSDKNYERFKNNKIKGIDIADNVVDNENLN